MNQRHLDSCNGDETAARCLSNHCDDVANGTELAGYYRVRCWQPRRACFDWAHFIVYANGSFSARTACVPTNTPVRERYNHGQSDNYAASRGRI